MGTSSNASTSGSVPKGVLRRMPRVESDETHHAEVIIPIKRFFNLSVSYLYACFKDEGSGGGEHSSGPKEEKVISPLGAGLPLLARLKLLKERQVHIR